MPLLEPVFLAGPTAVGKSAVAMILAGKVGGEIISVDSMQVYRGLNIGSAKPTPEERARISHHLIDVCAPSEAFDAARFASLARDAQADILGRGRTPIFCGGTGLYFKALLGGLGESPTPDPALRAELEATPLAALCRELEAGDPATFARIDRQNPRRVVRAVEVLRLTGKPFSAQRADWSATAGRSLIALRRAPDNLRERINQRVDDMFRAGLIEETERLLGQGLERNRTAMQAIGYRQVVEFLNGDRSREETVDRVKSKTRQFARRQMTWFRNQASPRWIDIEPGAGPENAADRVLELGPR